MERKGNSLDRRSVLRKVAGTSIVGAGLVASGDTVTAADGAIACHFLTIDGKSGETNYTVELYENDNVWGAVDFEENVVYDDPKSSPRRIGTVKNYLEDSDSITGTTLEGEVNGGYIDQYESPEEFLISSIDVDGGEVVAKIGSYGGDSCNENTISAYRPLENIEIDISGDGTYTLGYWKAGSSYPTLSGKNLEGSEIETCFPRGAPDRKAIELVCVAKDRGEGVRTRNVEISDPSGTYSGEYQFGTGEVHGSQYVDTFELADGPPNAGWVGPKYIHLQGDLTVDVTYNIDD